MGTPHYFVISKGRAKKVAFLRLLTSIQVDGLFSEGLLHATLLKETNLLFMSFMNPFDTWRPVRILSKLFSYYVR